MSVEAYTACRRELERALLTTPAMGALFRTLCLLFLVLVAGKPQVPAKVSEPELRTGDVVLQTSSSARSALIRKASQSPYSHVGLVEAAPDGLFVIEAIQPVSRTPWKAWRARGRDGKVTVLRAHQLPAESLAQVVAQAKAWVGRPYDARYRWDDETLYCSELVTKAFERGAGVTLGQQQRLKDLKLSKAELETAAQLGILAEQQLVTPGSLARDAHLSVVWTNF